MNCQTQDLNELKRIVQNMNPEEIDTIAMTIPIEHLLKALTTRVGKLLEFKEDVMSTLSTHASKEV